MLVSRRTEAAFYEREEIAAAIRMARADPAAHRVVPVYLDAASAAEPPYGLTVKHGVRVDDGGDLVPVAERLVALLLDLKTWRARRRGWSCVGAPVLSAPAALSALAGDGLVRPMPGL